MGLDTTHEAWHGPYSSFNSFRTEVAKHIGISLRDMVGFGGVTEWGKYKMHPLYELLSHSDCDGEIDIQHLKGIADSLKQIAPFLSQYNESKALQFADGCLVALSLNEPIEFR